MSRRFTILSYLLISVITEQAIIAQEATFVAEVDPTTVGSGEQFEVAYVFKGPAAVSSSNFRPPDFKDFVVLTGPNFAQTIQTVNGRGSLIISYSYMLYARQPGTYTIGSASIDAKGTTLKSAPVKVTVVRGKQQPQSQAAAASPSVGDNILLRAVADRQRVRLGEQVIVTWKIYLRVNMSFQRFSKVPSFEGFWGEDFDLPKQAALTTEVYNGKQYRAAILKKTALFPSQVGNLKVGPMELVVAAQVQSKKRSNDPFEQFFNDPFFQTAQTVDVTLTSDPLTITVDPLPPGAPAGFGNAVGTFDFAAIIDRMEVKAGDAITLKVTIGGKGNLKLVQLPKPVVPGDIEMYEPKFEDSITREGGEIRGKRTAEYVLVPRNAGQRSIEPMTFSFFEPARNRYVTLRSRKFELNILPGREFASSASGISKEDVRLLGQDIRFIRQEPGTLAAGGPDSYFGPEAWVALLLPPLGFIGAFVYRKRREQIYGDLPSFRFERAGREASRRLKQARVLLGQGNTEEYHAEVLRALTGYLEHKLRIPKSSMASDQVLSLLRDRGVSDVAIDEVRTCLERAEFARFAPGADSRAVRKDLLGAAGKAIQDVEHSFRS